MINVLDTPVIQIESLKTKFDTVVVSNSLIALLDHNYNEARFLQQLHYWSFSEYGVVIDGIRWIFKPINEWLTEVLVGLTEWRLRKAIASLLEKNLIRREKLFSRHQKQEYKSFWWQPKNQTYYYSINYAELEKLIKTAQLLSEQSPALQDAGATRRRTENGRIEEYTKLSSEVSLATKYCELSQNRSKNTNQRKPTTKQSGDRAANKSESIAAATSKETSEEGENQKSSNPHSEQLTASPGQNKVNLDLKESNPCGEKNVAQVDYKVNAKWRSLVSLLDSAGIPINKTLKDLLKLYPAEKVENAIAIVRARKRDQYIPNLSGYFVSALKGDWASQDLVDQKGDRNSEEIDKGAVFRHWYDLARELGYCSGQEMREGEQWVCVSGTWESWSNAIKRGYSLEYLKKIMKRNKN